MSYGAPKGNAIARRVLMTSPSRSGESFRFADRRHAGITLARELHGQLIRLAFRAAALPEQLDGLAPGELTPGWVSTEDTATLLAATQPSRHNGS
jgi:hypothetical protein